MTESVTLNGGPSDGKIVNVSESLRTWQQPIIVNGRVTKIAKYVRSIIDSKRFEFMGYL